MFRVYRGASFELLPEDALTSLCESRCGETLKATRTAIKNACTRDTDVLVPDGDIAYPGMLLSLQRSQFQCLRVVFSDVSH